MPRTIETGLTPANLSESIEEIIAAWSDDEWGAFFDRYLAAQFGGGGARPKASIPARADDDDLILGHVIRHARAHLKAGSAE